jgi:hypothetical protein
MTLLQRNDPPNDQEDRNTDQGKDRLPVPVFGDTGPDEKGQRENEQGDQIDEDTLKWD